MKLFAPNLCCTIAAARSGRTDARGAGSEHLSGSPRSARVLVPVKHVSGSRVAQEGNKESAWPRYPPLRGASFARRAESCPSRTWHFPARVSQNGSRDPQQPLTLPVAPTWHPRRVCSRHAFLVSVFLVPPLFLSKRRTLGPDPLTPSGALAAMWLCSEHRAGRVGALKYSSCAMAVSVVLLSATLNVKALFAVTSVVTLFIVGERKDAEGWAGERERKVPRGDALEKGREGGGGREREKWKGRDWAK